MARFVQIAMGSGTELSYHLLLAKDLGILTKEKYMQLDKELGEIMRMLHSFSQRLKNGRAA